MPTVGYPIINGNSFDYSSVELKINALKYTGIRSINYKQELQPGKVYGAGAPQLIGRTRGQLDVSGSIEIYREEFLDLTTSLQNLAVGLLEANFVVTVTYSELPPVGIPGAVPSPTQSDTIVGVRLQNVDTSPSQGSDPITVKC